MTATLSRRDFLKSAAATGFTLSILGAADSPARGSPQENQVKPTYEWLPNICSQCVSSCGIKVKVKVTGNSRRAVKIDGNPDHPFSRGRICARGQAGLRRLYDPQRITRPLIRVEGSERGQWAFRAVTWQEAYQYIMRRMQEEQIQPWEMAAAAGWISCAFYRPYLVPFAISTQMPNIIATPMQHCVMGEHFGIDSAIGTFNVHDEVVADYENAKVILTVGSNAAISAISTGRAVRFAGALRNGAKVIALDPRLSELAAKADTWVPIKPGTDLAFLLAVMHVLVREGLFEREFVARHSNAPFLVTQKGDQVELVQDVDPQSGQVVRYYVYDENSGEIRAVPAYSGNNTQDVDGNAIEAALSAPAGITWQGQKVRTVFQVLADRLRQYTPQWAAEICDVSAPTIEQVAEDLGRIRPALIEPGWHDGRYAASPMTRRVATLLQLLVGGIDKPGSWVLIGGLHEIAAHFYDFISHPEAHEGQQLSALQLPGLRGPQAMLEGIFGNPQFWSHGRPAVATAWSQQQWQQGKDGVAFPLFPDLGYEDAVEGKLQWQGEPYRIKALFLSQTNMIRNFPATAWEKILSSPDMKLVVAIDVQPNDTTLYADVILPDQMYLEKHDPVFEVLMSHDLAVQTRVPAVPPPGETKHTIDMFAEMAVGMGADYAGWLARVFGYPEEEIKPRILQAVQEGRSALMEIRNYQVERWARQLGKSVDEIEAEFQERGVVVVEPAHEILEKWAMPEKLPLPTPTGRAEFFSVLTDGFVKQYGYKPNWDPILAWVPPVWKESMRPEDGPPEGEFFFAYGKVPVHSHTATVNLDLLMALSENKKGPYMGLWVHPDSAAKLGIATGDRVRITNTVNGGSVEAEAFVTEMIRPDTVFLPAAFGSKSPMLKNAYGKGGALSQLWTNSPEPVVGALRGGEFTVRVEKA